MTLAEAFLQKLAEWKPASSGRQILTARDDGGAWSGLAHVDRCDGLSCMLWELALRRTAAAPAGRSLPSWALALPGKVTGLLEPLAIYEIDAARDEALLRSQEPLVKGDLRSYYEIRLRGNEQAIVRRYQASTRAGSHREQVAFTLTLEGLAKLVGDLTS